MIHKKIYELFPHIDREFLEYPLTEEGNPTPFLNFWCTDLDVLQGVSSDALEKGYEIDVENSSYIRKVHSCQINPIFEVQDDCSIVYANPEWSIEEMIDIIDSIVNRKKVDLVKEMN